MFGLFKSQPVPPQLPEEKRKYFDNQFHWLLENFGESFPAKDPLTPTLHDFPIRYDGSEKTILQTLDIVCRQMEIDPSIIELHFFDLPYKLNAGPGDVWLEKAKGTVYAGGYYHGRNPEGKYDISLRNDLLDRPEPLVRIMAHELAHYHLLATFKLNTRYDKDHELLTEMFCAFCGFGIFGANHNQGTGYLRQQSWGYLLALYAFLRDEKNPAWSKHLSGTVKKDFERSLRWLNETPAGKAFLDGKWTNDHYGMEKKNFSGTWIKQSTYGEHYGEGVAGKTMLTEIEITDEDGHLTGTGRDTEGHGIQDVPLTIKGTVRGDSIQFELQYQYADKIVDGIVVRKAEKESYAVTYSGYFSFFLDAFIGEWRILKEDPEKGLLSYGSGTWEMKRK